MLVEQDQNQNNDKKEEVISSEHETKTANKHFSQGDIAQLVIDTSRGHNNTSVVTEGKVASEQNYQQLAKMKLETSQNLIILNLLNTKPENILDVMENHFIKPEIDEKMKKVNAKIDPEKISHKAKKGVKGMGME